MGQDKNRKGETDREGTVREAEEEEQIAAVVEVHVILSL